MSTYSIYFSPTGGTKKVLQVFEERFQPVKPIDLTKCKTDYDKICFTKEDLCLVGIPSFGGRVPKAALERITQMSGGGAKTVIIAVYGNRAFDDTLLELKNELTSCGFLIAGAVAAVAEHSIMPQFGAGRPDEQDEQELKQFAIRIEDLLGQIKDGWDLKVPGNLPYRQYGGVPFKPQANKDCNQCGICAENCPVMAIAKENPAAADEKKCISCMRCVSICPRKARGLNKIVLFAASQKMKKECGERKNNELYLTV